MHNMIITHDHGAFLASEAMLLCCRTVAVAGNFLHITPALTLGNRGLKC